MVLVLILAAALLAQQPVTQLMPHQQVFAAAQQSATGTTATPAAGTQRGQQPAGRGAGQGAQGGGRGQAPVSPEVLAKLDYDVFKNSVEPILLAKRPGNIRCVTCHAGSASSAFRLQPLSPGAFSWNEEQSRANYMSVARLVVPGVSPIISPLLKHPLAKAAGGDAFHGGGKHWMTREDPEWKILASWVSGEKMKPLPQKVRILQTNSAGDNVHVIDPTTNKVVGIISDIELPHGVTSAPDGSYVYVTNESLSTVDVVNAVTYRVVKRIPLSGHPNNITISKDGKKVYAGIAQGSGAVDVIDTTTMTNVKSIPVQGAVHNVYVTPDGKFVVSGSVGSRYISIIDAATETMIRSTQLSAGIRPMAFDTNPDGSTRNIYVQLSDFHGVVAVDFATGKEIKRIEHPEVPGAEKHTEGLQGAPAHGLVVTPDGKTLWSTSKVNGYAYILSLPDLNEVGRVFIGQHPEWITLTPDGKYLYAGAAGDNATVAVDVQARKVIATIPVGQAPKRIATGMLQAQ